MRRASLPLFAWALASTFQVGSLVAQDSGVARDVTTCARVTASIRAEAYGYTHVVELKNTCDRPVVCQVWTDVDPEPKSTLKAMPGETDSVITRRGSPASAVIAQSSCQFEGVRARK